jgi:hypothetical protein
VHLGALLYNKNLNRETGPGLIFLEVGRNYLRINDEEFDPGSG